MPVRVAKHLGVRKTERSVNGPGFRAANGSEIKHHGQRTLKGMTDLFTPMSIVAQVADVQTTLGSVNQMLRAGNRVHFEPGNCYVQHVATGRITPIEEKAGTFEIGVWIPKGKDKRETATQPGFIRQDASAQM